MNIESMNLFGARLGGQERYTQALIVFQMVLKNGDKRALNDIGYTYELLGDYKKAREYYMSAIKERIPEGSYNLARLYEYGTDTEVDYTKAFELYQQALKLGYSEAAGKLANFYLRGLGVNKDDHMAYLLFKKGSFLDKKRHTYSLCTAGLANCYEQGVGCKQNKRKTFLTNVRAVKQARSGIHLYNLAQCYVFGTGTKVNIKKALELLYEAANKNYPDAYYQLAALYSGEAFSFKGKIYSLRQDDYSLFLLSEAYRYGSPKADLAVAEMSLSGSNPCNQVDISKAIEAVASFQTDKRHGNSADIENYKKLKNKYPTEIDWDLIEQDPERYVHQLNNESITC